MNDFGTTRSTASIVDPRRLIEILNGNGWVTVGRRAGTYERLRRRDDSSSTGLSVVIPLDRAANDFNTLMAAAIKTIHGFGEDVWARSIEPLLTVALVDRLRFRKETSAPRGLIAWKDGTELIESARLTLIAGAKAYMEPSRHFSNRLGQFANRYLDQVLMGQSGTGSYVINALVPSEAKISIRKADVHALELEDITFAHGREVTASVVRALEAAMEALDHFKKSGSMAAFDEGVASGVSYELVRALRDVAGGADQSDIVIQFSRSDEPDIIEPEAETYRFEFSGGDASVLERVSVQMSEPAQAERLCVEGRVHLLTRKEAGGPGVFGVDDGRYRYRVRLGSDDEYHEAVMAHDEDQHVMVEGDLSQEGNFRWLYNAQLMPSPDRATPEAPIRLRGQSELDLTDS